MDPAASDIPLFKYRSPAMIVGLVALVICIIGWFSTSRGADPGSFYRAYLFGWFFFLGISLGAMALMSLQLLTGGNWGILIRRICEAAALSMPVLIVLFIPIAIGAKYLYPWANPAMVAEDPILKMRSVAYNMPAWLIRSFVYMFIWWIFALVLRSLSLKHDANPQKSILERMGKVGCASLIIYFLTMTFASVDWVMSRETHWYSSVYGFITVVGQSLSGMVFILMMLKALSPRRPFSTAITADSLNDLGNLFLTLVILWAYMSLAQLLVTWMGNTQEDIVWYLQRTSGGWRWLTTALIIFHFFVPFFLLLSRNNKRRINIIGSLAAFVFILHLLDVLYQTVPSSTDEHGHSITWLVFVTPFAVGGIWYAVFLTFFGARPLLPVGDKMTTTGHGFEVHPSHGGHSVSPAL